MGTQGQEAHMTPLREIVETLLSYAGWPRKERWLAELVVRLVEERAIAECINPDYTFLDCPNRPGHIKDVLDVNDITPKQFEEIKRRLGYD